MSSWSDLPLPCERELVVGMFDLTGYTVYCQRTDDVTALKLITGYMRLAAETIETAGGYFIKAIGDAGLFVFFAEEADAALGAVQSLQANGDAWLHAAGYNGHVRFVMHAGTAVLGKLGAPGREQLDVIGSTVNIVGARRMEGRMAITPALFRKLSPESRQHFKKHTPPVSYIGVDDPHPKR